MNLKKKVLPIIIALMMTLNGVSVFSAYAQENQDEEGNQIVENINNEDFSSNQITDTTGEISEEKSETDGIEDEKDSVTLNQNSDETSDNNYNNSNKENLMEEDFSGIESDNQKIQIGNSSLVEYFYVGSPYLSTPATQQFVLSFGSGTEGISSVKLQYQKDDGEAQELETTQYQNGLYVFEKAFTDAETGTYKVNGFTYVIGEQTYEVAFSDLQMDIRFGVNQEYEGYGTAEGYTIDKNGNEVQEEAIDTQGLTDTEIETSIVSLDGSNSNETESLVEDALQNNALPASNARSRSNSISTYSETNPLVICIDPGHGGNDGGSTLVNGVSEKVYNLKIAQYLKAELEQYKNVKVVMTRTGDTNPSLQERAQIAANNGAKALVSIHLNATGLGSQTGASGAEIYYPNTNYKPELSQTGLQMANNIMNQLTSLGIPKRFITVKYVYDAATGNPVNDDRYDYPDNSIGDYYGVIRYSKLLGVAGIIVEHCYGDNWNDINNFLGSEDKIKKLGVADATGIANAFGLQKTPKTINYSVHCQTYGWMNTVGDGQTAGTSGESKRLESIKISLGETGYSGGIQYRTHVQTYGWQGWKQDGQESGTTGQSKRLEAIQIKLTGDIANYYDVYYRTHVQQFGWLGWAKNGESSGSSGYSYRMEAIEIVLVKKGGSAPGSTSNCYYDKNAEQAKGYTIMGSSNVTAKQLVNYYNTNKGSSSYDKFSGSNSKHNGTFSKGGADTIEKFCQMYIEECKAEGVKAEVAFAQTMHETGFLKFGGDVLPNQYNFAGLGATGNGATGNSFKDVRTGIRAHVQHLKCYASTEPLNQEKVDPRWSDSLRGKAPTVEKLQGTWASSNTYASSLMKGVNSILKS
ncbi:N-acetylmuramoyl-L-alanine amidase [uncultured Faecalicoccus sp.]|uniref:N-acetylmuramoyl-L-alanine amidase n=1 Tax=uncultured Faecalicoccus sp. TaxID=1971760 RepID=UPI0025CBD58F|nr:N-acetylmuramoyl-L-alanine amidase [uncultured Faecalicoccus sp.]